MKRQISSLQPTGWAPPGGCNAVKQEDDDSCSQQPDSTQQQRSGGAIHSEHATTSSRPLTKPFVMMPEFEEEEKEEEEETTPAVKPAKSTSRDSEYTTYQRKLQSARQQPEQIARGQASLRPQAPLPIPKQKFKAASTAKRQKVREEQEEEEEDKDEAEDSFISHLQQIKQGQSAAKQRRGQEKEEGSEVYRNNIQKALNNGLGSEEDNGMDVYNAVGAGGDGGNGDDDDIHPMDPTLIPRGFDAQVKDAAGNIDFAKLTDLTRRAHGCGRTKKLLEESVVAEDDDKKIATDVEGFLYEPCMLPQTYHERQVLRKMALAQLGRDAQALYQERQITPPFPAKIASPDAGRRRRRRGTVSAIGEGR
jgi:hypothetical protein